MTVKKSKVKQPKNNQPEFTVSENFLIDQFEESKKKTKREREASEPEKKVGKLFKKKKGNILEQEEEITPLETTAAKKSNKIKNAPQTEEPPKSKKNQVSEAPSKAAKTVKAKKSKEQEEDNEEPNENVPGFDAPRQPKKRKHDDEKVPAKKLKKSEDAQKKELTGKELKVERKKKANPNRYDLSVKAKKMWEELRREDTPKDRQLSLGAELYGMLKGTAKELVFAHDTARVIECLFEKSSQDIRDALFNELKSHTINLARSQYAHFYLIKVLRHGNKEQRNYIINALSGKVVYLMKHKIAAKVVETAYNDWANASQRAQLSQEFYGPEFKVFKDESVTTLSAAIEKHPEKKDSFLKYMNEAIEPIIEKGVFNHSLLHRLLSEYLYHCKENERAEMIQSLRLAAVQVLHTRDGARVAMMCLWFGTQKDRKEIIKSFKGNVAKICQEEHGHMVLMALFDCVDDTKLVGKAIVSEIASNWRDIVVNEHGRKVIMYLLAGRDPTYTHPQVIDILKKGDGNPHSKKDAATRRKELLQSASPALLEAVTHEPQLWLTDNSNCLVLGALLKLCEGASELSAAFKAVASIVGKELDEETQRSFNSEKEKINHWVEQSAIHMTLKKLIQFDKQRNQPPYISQALIDEVDDDVLKGWIACNRGAFLLVNMMETEKDEIVKSVSNRLKEHRKLIQKQKNKGADLLDAKLSNFK